MEIVGENKKREAERKREKESQWREIGRWEEEKISKLRIGGNTNCWRE